MTTGVYSYVCTANTPAPMPQARIVADPPRRWRTRRWESADTNRLNRAHWRKANGNSLNQDITDRLETLRNRCEFEAANNPTVDGVIQTHQNDVFGPLGPTFRVHSDSETYNERLEKAWIDWFYRPTLHPRRSGISLFRLLWGNLWKKGEFLLRKTNVTGEFSTGPVDFRVNPIDPKRLATPSDYSGDPNVINGVRVDQNGVPIQFYILAEHRYAGSVSYGPDYETIPADLIIHGFIWLEEDQTRGVPWLATSLDSISNGRDYEKHVLEAAKNHAANSLWFFTRHPEAQYIEVNEHTTIQPGTASTCPPGWEPFSTQPTQPGATYFDYLKERQREIGRPASMPLITVRLDASEHNMAAARYDGQVYMRSLRAFQMWFALETLNECVDEIAKELRFDPSMPKRPKNVTYQWIFPSPPHVDRLKESNADRVDLENGIPWSYIIASHDIDPDVALKQIESDNKKLAKAGLPSVPIFAWGETPADPAYEDDDEKAAKAEKKAKSSNPSQKSPKQLARA